MRCDHCFSVVAKGISHKCTRVNKRDNLAELVKNQSGKTKGKVAGDALKSLLNDDQGSSSTSTGDSLHLHSKRGKPMRVAVNPPPPKKARFDHEAIKRLQTSRNFSDRDTL